MNNSEREREKNTSYSSTQDFDEIGIQHIGEPLVSYQPYKYKTDCCFWNYLSKARNFLIRTSIFTRVVNHEMDSG